jgi:hypothetical protein
VVDDWLVKEADAAAGGMSHNRNKWGNFLRLVLIAVRLREVQATTVIAGSREPIVPTLRKAVPASTSVLGDDADHDPSWTPIAGIPSVGSVR